MTSSPIGADERGKRVFIVEDEALIAMELADRLGISGYVICGRVARGEDALDGIPQANPDVVLMDVRLAGVLTGVETAVKLREASDVPIVFLSANTDPSALASGEIIKPAGYVSKPFDYDLLVRVIAEAVGIDPP